MEYPKSDAPGHDNMLKPRRGAGGLVTALIAVPMRGGLPVVLAIQSTGQARVRQETVVLAVLLLIHRS